MVPDEPHVGFAKRIEIQENGTPIFVVHGGMIMIAHGIAVSNKSEDWLFEGTKRRVSDTVKAYEQWAQMRNYPQIDVLVVCRQNIKPGTEVPMDLESTGRVPYISPSATVWLRASDTNPFICRPGEGAESLVLDARGWKGIGQWNQFWHQGIRQQRTIPDWAKLPSLAV
jgi:hypothetical protein